MKKYEIEKEKCECTITEFYDHAARIIGIEYGKEPKFDCRKICVTKKVQECLWEHYRSFGCLDEEIASLFLGIGPKACLEDDGYFFTIEEGFVVDGD